MLVNSQPADRPQSSRNAMRPLDPNRNSAVASAFDAIAPTYDTMWTGAFIGALQRRQVWQELDSAFRPGERVLEIGCGTGVDAVHLAQAGLLVHATDISMSMLGVARQRIEREGLSRRITLDHRAVEDLIQVDMPGPFDGAYSNFGVFNCVQDFHVAASNLRRLIRPGGKLIICLMGRFCLWETAWYLLHGKLQKAFRRLRGGNGGSEASLVPGLPIRVFYPSIARLASAFRPSFTLLSSCGIGVLVPPSCMEEWAQVRRGAFSRLAVLDERVRRLPVLRALADHRLLVFARTAAH